jgi:endonuclease IV
LRLLRKGFWIAVRQVSAGRKRRCFSSWLFGKNKEGAAASISKAVKEVLAEVKRNGWKITISPETMGKVNVFGSVEEISSLVNETGCGFCIDFAHILAREKSVDYAKVAELFPQKDWHVHFSGMFMEIKARNHRRLRKKSGKFF